MRKISLLLIIFAILLIPCLAQKIKTQNQQIEISNEEYAVYSAVINKMFAGDKVTFDTQSQIKLLVIRDHTIKYALHVGRQDWQYLEKRLPEESQEIFNDFLVKVKEQKQLKDNFKIELKRTLIKKDETEQMFKEKEKEKVWERFYKSFPNSGGYIGLSRIGFDTKKKHAVVYMEHRCHELCASGHLLLLKKTEEGWTVLEEFGGWMA
jgi:chaperonin GroEL (HSP60 family)